MVASHKYSMWMWMSGLVVLFVALTFTPGQATRRPVVIASKNFTENQLLAEILAQLIEAKTDIPVERKFNLGASAILFQGLTRGDIDMYPEYTGTGWAIHLKIRDLVRDPLKAYVIVSERMKKEFGIRWLQPLGFNNSFAVAMSKKVANKLGVTRISELREHQDQLRFGTSPQFREREDGYPGLVNTYNLDFGDVKTLEHGLAYEAIRNGEIDLVDTWTTDGKLLKLKMVLLEDDEGFFPPYDAVPIIREETLKRYPELEGVLNELGFKIDNKKMQELNLRVEEGESVEDVARSFLVELGELAEGQYRKTSQLGYLADIPWYTVQHLLLTGIAVVLAIMVSIPLGILLTRWVTGVPWVLGAAGIIQTTPSLALLVFMMPIFGLGADAAIAALFLYALLPIIRNTYTGIKEVDSHLLEAARAIGLKDHQILWRVELPLATRTIMAGVRTSTVISIGIATLAAFIGAGGLGSPIINGLQRNDLNLVFAGAIPAALLALGVDFALGVLEKAVMPRGMETP